MPKRKAAVCIDRYNKTPPLKNMLVAEKTSPGVSPAFFALAVLLGTVSGFLPWDAPLNVLVLALLCLFRIPLVWFGFFYALAKFASLKWLAQGVASCGLTFLTSDGTVEFARWLAESPVVCYLGLTDTAVCGGMIIGGAAGLLLGYAAFGISSRLRNRGKTTP